MYINAPVIKEEGQWQNQARYCRHCPITVAEQELPIATQIEQMSSQKNKKDVGQAARF